jgi:outer membrane receptor for ferrienterochelin and colicins
MKSLKLIITAFFLTIITSLTLAQRAKTDANVFGHVVDTRGEHIPFSSIAIRGTTLGVTADETGHFRIINLPEGTHILVAQALGYRSAEAEIIVERDQSIELNFILESDALGLDEVIITGNRNETNRRNSSVIVNTITPQVFTSTNSLTLAEGLNFSPGLRVENNCQNCGFTQVRMNGMEGPYSQILINSRPIFSGLAGVYALEMIPANMIERVEVIRGGGSALYGSNAIAGTINLILKDPQVNAYDFDLSGSTAGIGMDKAGSLSEEYAVRFNSSNISASGKTGISIFGFYRDRTPFDANDDGFTEITQLDNLTLGSRLFHRPSNRGKINLDFFSIREKRRGGSDFERPIHMADIAEALEHNITTGALSFDQFFRTIDQLSVYASGQRVKRDSYYGAGQSLSDYGFTQDFSYVVGAQYRAMFNNSNLIFGVENDGARLIDRKLAHYDLDDISYNGDEDAFEVPIVGNRTVADQRTSTFAAFAQYEIDFNRLNISAGARLNSYHITDEEKPENDNSGNIITPRITMKYDIRDHLQARVSYAQGYRAPQIFDEDLHIETSAARQVTYENAPNLKAEKSESFMASFDYTNLIGNTYIGFLAEGFHTRLHNAFASEYGEPDENGLVVYKRVNADGGAVVQGVNLELFMVPSTTFELRGGFTIQSSRYEEEQEFEEKRFFRTPSDYGYMTMEWKPTPNFIISPSVTYTGKMLIPYFPYSDELDQPLDEELRESDPFLDLGLKLSRNFRFNGNTFQIYAGMKNILNSYQKDFERGINRDPGYIYGPIFPRTIFFGVKLGNFIR